MASQQSANREAPGANASDDGASRGDEPVVLIVMGVSGSGKTTVGRRIAERLGWHFFEGDDFHPDANVEKMSASEPLTDEDRREWLDEIRALAARLLRQGRSAVIACSALKRTYRQTIRGEDGPAIQFIYLKGDYTLVQNRLEERTGHFMPPDLLRSQFEALQEPSPHEEGILEVSIEQPPAAIADEVVRHLNT